MADFVKAAAVAKRLIEANGRAVTLARLNRVPANASQPWRGSSSEPDEDDGGLSIPVIACFVPVSGTGFGRDLVDEARSMNVRLSQFALIASGSLPTGVAPEDVETCDVLLDEVSVWKIVVRSHLRPASTSVLFAVGLTR